MLNKLLDKLPKTYHYAVQGFESDSGLVDNCKYMLYLDERYTEETSFPCKSIREAVNFVKTYIEPQGA